MNPTGAEKGLLYQSDLQGQVRGVSVAMDQNAVFSPAGLLQAKVPFNFYGLVATAVPHSGEFNLRLFSMGHSVGSAPSVPVEYCNRTFGGELPLAGMQFVALDQFVYGSLDQSTGKYLFFLAKAPAPVNLPLQPQVSDRKRSPLGTCLPSPIGYPSHCEGCAPYNAVCGCTKSCAGGCCYTLHSKIMCCSAAPTGAHGFSCH